MHTWESPDWKDDDTFWDEVTDDIVLDDDMDMLEAC